MIVGIHHAQITIPKGKEHEARQFYCGVLQLKEITKPDSLKGRDGFWVEVGNRQLHIGTENGVDRTRTKAHIAYEVEDIQLIRKKLNDAGIDIIRSVPIPGYDRFEFRDPFGNRVECIQSVIEVERQFDYFISQHDDEDYPDVSCGVACLMTLLKYHNLEQHLSYRDLADQLKLTVPPVSKGYKSHNPEIGVYPEDVYRFLIRHQILFRVSFLRHEWEECLEDGPIMVLMIGPDERFGVDGHWIVLVSMEAASFAYLDPSYSRTGRGYYKRISEHDFYQSYTGVSCQIIGR